MSASSSGGDPGRVSETIVFSPTRVDGSLDGSGEGEPSGFGKAGRVGRYVLLEVVGVGGMGVVCTAFDPKLDRKVALKLLRDHGAPGSRRATTGRARLVREAQALAKLSHPNIVTVHDVDYSADGKLYMAMEFVDGQTLAQWIERARPGWQEVLTCYAHAGDGLAAAHAAGITHRDFKPANVLIGKDQRVRVVDFGLAKQDGDEGTDGQAHAEGDDACAPLGDIMHVLSATSDLKLTQAGRIVGTPAYMAPEQRRGHEVGPATDQFGFAVALYEGLYGLLPFSSDNRYADARKGRIAEPAKDSQVPSWVYRVLCVALQPKPEMRYPTMDALLVALRSDPAKRRRQQFMWGSAGAGALIVAVGGWAAAGAWALQQAGVCKGSGQRIAQVWGPEQQQRVGDSLRRTQTAYADYTASRVVAALDVYAEQWASTRVRVCEATRLHEEQSEALMDVRMTCLDRRRGELSALVKVLADADSLVVERAVAAVHDVDPADSCATALPDPGTALPRAVHARRDAVAAQARVDEAKAQISAGRYEAALAAAQAGKLLADTAGHAASQARAAYYQGVALRGLNRDEEALEALDSAVFAAARAGDANLEARAWSTLAYVTGPKLRQMERARAMARAAAAATVRAGSPPELEAAVRTDTATVLLSTGAVREALVALDEALLNAVKVHGVGHPLTYNIVINLGVTHARLKQPRQAELYFRRALAEVEEGLGPAHPKIAMVAQNLGNLLADQGPTQSEAAADLLGRALRLRAARLGDEHPKVAELWVAMARLDRKREQFGAAKAKFERAVAVFRTAGRDHRAAQTLNNLGNLAIDQGDPLEARKQFKLSRQLIAGGDDKLLLARLDAFSCHASLNLQDYARAQLECEAAVAGFGAMTGGEARSDLADLHAMLALAVHGQGKREAFLALARQATPDRDLGAASKHERTVAELLARSTER